MKLGNSILSTLLASISILSFSDVSFAQSDLLTPPARCKSNLERQAYFTGYNHAWDNHPKQNSYRNNAASGYESGYAVGQIARTSHGSNQRLLDQLHNITN